MHASGHRVTIKRYGGRRLYAAGSGTYVTAEEVAVLAQTGANVVVLDAVTGEDLTDFILAQHRLH